MCTASCRVDTLMVVRGRDSQISCGNTNLPNQHCIQKKWNFIKPWQTDVYNGISTAILTKLSRDKITPKGNTPLVKHNKLTSQTPEGWKSTMDEISIVTLQKQVTHRTATTQNLHAALQFFVSYLRFTGKAKPENLFSANYGQQTVPKTKFS